MSTTNTTVDSGGFFEMRIDYCYPNITDKIFDRIEFGYLEGAGDFIPLAKVIKKTKSMELKGLHPLFKGRIKTIGNWIIRLTNITLADEGWTFYFKLYYWNETHSKPEEVLKTIKLVKVNGK